jgi:hypothetical protein
MILAITPHRAGAVKVDGFDVRYRHQLRFGRQHLGGTTTVTASTG